jgi:hypothetical protein
MSQQKSQKSNWVIQAEHKTKHDEKTFLSMFGEMTGKGLNKPNKDNEILNALVSISYYEHNDGDGTSITLRKRMMVSITLFEQYLALLSQ